MILKNRTWLLSILSAIILLSACSKSNKQGKLIPKDAAFVMHINGQSITSKLPWEEIKKNSVFEKIYSDSTLPPIIKTVLDNPENSGIDIKNDLLIFAQEDSSGNKIVFEGSLKDVEKFKLFNQEASKGGSITEKEGISFILKHPIVAGWNKEKFVYVMDAPQFSLQKRDRYAEDSSGSLTTKRDLIASCKAIFDLKEDNSLGTDEKFTTLMKKEGDFHIWVNTGQLYKNTAGIGGLSMLNINKFYEGNIMVATGSFDNGKINLNYKTYVGKELKAILKKYSGGSIDEEMLKRIPSKEIAAVFALHFKPEGLKELISLTGMDGLINIGLVAFGFSIDDFIKANKGDILIAVTDFKTTTDSIKIPGMDGIERSFENNSVSPTMFFSASIGDKDAFNQLIKAGKKFSDGKMEDSSFTIDYQTNDKYFAIGNSKSTIEKYLASPNNNYEFISQLAGNPMGGYVNLQYIMKSMHYEMAKDSSEKLIYEASLKMWDNIYLKGGDFSDGGLSYDIEFNLMDKNTNSLKQLNQYFGQIGQQLIDKNKPAAIIQENVDKVMNNKKEMVPPPPPSRKLKKNK